MAQVERVLVTGAAGFIGSHLVDALLEAGIAVVGLDDLSMGCRENLVQRAEQPRFELRVGDVCDPDAVRQAARGCDHIVHLAALKIPRYGGALRTLEVNASGAGCVLEEARSSGARVILISTSDVYGKSGSLPYAESGDLTLGPPTVGRWAYAASKLYAEHLGFAFREAHGLRVAVLRLFGAYGPRQHRSWWGGPQSVFIERLLRGEAVPIHGDGRQTRTFTFVSDTVAGILAALRCDQADGEILNIGAAVETDILGLARLLHGLLGLSGEPVIEWVPYSSFARGYEDVRRRVPDPARAQKLLGFCARVPLEEGLRRTIAWQRPLVEAELREARGR
jgi:UDP-glucose 4-epimerase